MMLKPQSFTATIAQSAFLLFLIFQPFLSNGLAQCLDSPINDPETGQIPDDQSQCFEDVTTITGFDSGTTWADLPPDEQLLGVEIEHSYMGDLTISFTCPTGQSMLVHAQGGGQTFLGMPVDVDMTPDIPGVGFEYFWAPSATNGTWAENEQGTLPAGIYQATGDWSALANCPMNGTWEISICDSWGSDNGFLFSWDVASWNEDVIQCDVEYETEDPSSACSEDGTIDLMPSSEMAAASYVVELSSNGALLESLSLDGPVSFEGLTEGDYLVSVYSPESVLAYESPLTLVGVFDPEASNADEICAIEYDPASHRNRIIWTKWDDTNIASYEIQRESPQTGDYDAIGSVHADSLSEFIDIDFNPAEGSARYNLVALDSCGVGIDHWPFHRTMHLFADVGANDELNFYWNAYEGVTYSDFEIHRSTDGVNFFQIGTAPNTSFAFSDLNPPAGDKWYQVRIPLNAPCDPIRSFVTSFIGSNILDFSTTEIAMPPARPDIDLLVTSSANGLTIQWDGMVEDGILELFDASGRQLDSHPVHSTSGQTTLDSRPGALIVHLRQFRTGARKFQQVLVPN